MRMHLSRRARPTYYIINSGEEVILVVPSFTGTAIDLKSTSHDRTLTTTQDMVPVAVMIFIALFGASFLNEHAIAYGVTGSLHSPNFRKIANTVLPLIAFLTLICGIFAIVAANGCRVTRFASVICAFALLLLPPLLQYQLAKTFPASAFDSVIPMAFFTIGLQALITYGIAKMIRVNAWAFVPPCILSYVIGSIIGVVHLMTMNE